MIEEVAPTSQEGRLPFSPWVEEEGGTSLRQARLTDQQRIAVVLEGAALLGHLEAFGSILPRGWDGATLDDQGRLRVSGVREGRSAELVQVQLVGLLLTLFDSDEDISGRGEARKGGRQLVQKWRQTLTPLAPRDAVADIFEHATFLWQDGFALSRGALVADGETAAGERQLSLVAPPRIRRRLLRRGADRAALYAVLTSSQAHLAWQGEVTGAATVLAAAGQWERAIIAWQRQPPADADESLALAQCLFSLGRYGRALEVLRRHQRFEAMLLRLWCQAYLGEIDAALKTLHQANKKPLTGEQLLRLGEVAIRVLAARRKDDEIGDWVARCQAVAKGRLKLRASLLAAAASWDREDWSTMQRHLEAAASAEQDGELAGRWHHLMGLWARSRGDSLRSVEHMQRAVRLQRRGLGPAAAGRLWNDLAIVRAAAGDLAGAERACRHAVRLLRDSEGPGRTTLALYNLAEVRIRRGRLTGVETILEASTASNRRSKNERGLVHDLELWVRFELAQGRAAAALARCTEAVRQFDTTAIGDRRQVFDLFAARAHGWLGRRGAAADCLARVDHRLLQELEEEERPSVLALAGRFDDAVSVAAEGPWGELWRCLAAARHPPPRTWEGLRRLEPFRAARLIFDCELALAGSVPPHQVRNAIVTLRRCGAASSADRLENRSLSPWQALEGYLEPATPSLREAAQLLEASGFHGARLRFHRDGDDRTLISGDGGEVRLEAPWGGGLLCLEVERSDRILETLFRLLCRDLEPPERQEEVPATVGHGTGILGQSPSWIETLTRVERLASGNLPMLILGESGTGKELVADLVHRRSPRAAGPYLPVNCAAMSENLIQSDLFGHVRGAFTGADRDRAGIFESAKGGTVFLDEIGDLPLADQGKLLRVLQEGEVRRVGESFSRKIDARVITATHRDLEGMVQAGEFRQDLFFRLKVATVRLPALRERGGDVAVLAEHFLDGLRRHQPHLRLLPGAKERLMAHDWPGNVRELKSTLEVAAALAGGGDIDVEHLELPDARPTRHGDYHRQVENVRRQLLVEALDKSGGNRAEAARILGLSRQALSYLVRQLGLS